MAEVPEHLLQRSRDRRAALGLPVPGAEAPTGEGSGGDAGASAGASSSPAPVAAGNSPAPAPPIAKAKPLPPSNIGTRQIPEAKYKPPWYALIVVVGIPLWAFFYYMSLGDRPVLGATDPLVRGQELYISKGCGGCHGTQGEGGVGPALAAGETVKTFPEEADHIKWVTEGATPAGTKYGDPNREGGQRTSTGNMPAFGSTTSAEDIEAVVKYEREKLGRS